MSFGTRSREEQTAKAGKKTVICGENSLELNSTKFFYLYNAKFRSANKRHACAICKARKRSHGVVEACISAEGLSGVSNSLKFVVQKRRQIHNLATIRIN